MFCILIDVVFYDISIMDDLKIKY